MLNCSTVAFSPLCEKPLVWCIMCWLQLLSVTNPRCVPRRKQKELEELERERKREEKLRKREQKQRDRELRRNQKKLEKLQAEEQKQLQEKIKLEERKLLLAQRNLQSIRLIAELLSRAKVPGGSLCRRQPHPGCPRCPSPETRVASRRRFPAGRSCTHKTSFSAEDDGSCPVGCSTCLSFPMISEL